MRNVLTITACLSLFASYLSAQISTVNGFNYYDINRNAFTVNASCMGLDTEAKREIEYWFTCLELGEKVTSVFNQKSEDAQAVVGNYKIVKDYYTNKELGNEPIKWILMRPNDNVKRPVIVLTHGGKSSDATTSRVLTLGAFDYLQRGYAVVYYQSGTSAAGNQTQAFIDAGLSEECLENNAIDKNMDCFQQAVYFKMLFNRAAVQYTVAKADVYNLNKDELFISGFSGGGVGSFYTALSDDDTFSHEMFQKIGDINSLSLYPDQEFEIKAVSTLAGGVIDPTSISYKIQGDLFDASDKNTRFLMLHGQDDTAVKADLGPLQWIDPSAELPGSRIACALNIKESMDEVGIPNKVVINCSAGHSIISYPCVFDDDDFSNNPKFSLGLPPECIKWALPENFSGYNYNNLCATGNARDYINEFAYIMMQLHDLAKMNAAFFSEDVDPSGPAKNQDEFINSLFSSNEVSRVLPIDFPYEENNNTLQNGHLGFSDRCLSQECTALYFDKSGIGNSVLLVGDFLQLKGSSLSQFNSNFTLEMKVKEINHQGKGVLFSHLNQLGIGFEISINNQGFLQFRRTVNGNGTITGDDFMLDGECHHVALQRNGNTFTLYLDGKVQGEPKTWNLDFPSSSKIRLGNTSNDLENGNNGFNGAMHSFRLWDKVLSISEFEQIDLSPDKANLLADFVFDQRFGQEIKSRNSNDFMTLGNQDNNTDYDPRWMSDDVFCEFKPSCISVNSTFQATSEQIEFSVYPNPSSGLVNLIFGSEGFKERWVEIYSIDGQLKLRSQVKEKKWSVDLEEAGMYLVKVHEGSKVETKKLVIMN